MLRIFEGFILTFALLAVLFKVALTLGRALQRGLGWAAGYFRGWR